MKVDLPKCGRCCFCFPIRCGLLVWAYLKMLVGAFLLAIMATYLHWFVKYPEQFSVAEIAQIFTNIVLIIYNGFTTIFGIVAAHKKSVKLFGIYIRVETGAILGNVLGIVVFIVTETIFCIENEYPARYILFYTLMMTIQALILIGTQVYTILLVRSKIELMTNKEGFKFSNIGAEAECAYYNNENANIVIENEVVYSDRDKVYEVHDAVDNNYVDSRNKSNN